MKFDQCGICGLRGFRTWEAYHHHHQSRHNVKPLGSKEKELVIESIELVKTYCPMNPSTKQIIVEMVESQVRLAAWDAMKLNTLIGEDANSVEPIWNKKMEVI